MAIRINDIDDFYNIWNNGGIPNTPNVIHNNQPPQLACEEGLTSVFLPDGTQECVELAQWIPQVIKPPVTLPPQAPMLITESTTRPVAITKPLPLIVQDITDKIKENPLLAIAGVGALIYFFSKGSNK